MKMHLMTCVAAILVAALPVVAATTSQMSQFGITWTFAAPAEYGQFANGDYWVIGPVQVTAISPPSTNVGGRTKNGSMINPGLGMTQGYDSAMYGTYGPAYSASMNKALGVSAGSPLTVQPGSSLISSISIDAAGNRPQLKAAAVLTVLSAPAPAGSFRPPYYGNAKIVQYNESDINFSRLPRLAPVAGTPSLTNAAGNFQRPWLEHVLSWTGRYCHPSDNMPDYGESMCLQIGDAALLLCLDYSDAQKETLLIRLVQYGIDLYAIASAGGVWDDLGGHMHGRKLPILLAGLVLDDLDMLDIGSTLPNNFQEDRQTWYVTQADVGRPLYHADGRPRVEYIQADVGVAEWGEQHTRQSERDGRNWSAYYRRIVGHSILGPVLAANIIGLRDEWQWEALFDYIDRYWDMENARTSGTHLIPTFHKNMWTAYRGTTGGGPIADAGGDRTVNDTEGAGVVFVTLDATASTAGPGATLTGYLWSEDGAYMGSTAEVIAVLPLGVHTITLKVTDSEGGESTDTIVITVKVPDLVADAGEDVEVTDTNGDGYEVVILNGAGSYHTSLAITDYMWTEDGGLLGFAAAAPAAFTVGEHIVTLRVTSSDGEQAFDIVNVIVLDGTTLTPGDFDGDGDVDLDDFVILKQNFGRDGATRSDGDADGDGDVDLDDFVIFKQNFGG